VYRRYPKRAQGACAWFVITWNLILGPSAHASPSRARTAAVIAAVEGCGSFG